MIVEDQRLKPPDPLNVAIDRCMATIEHELGPITLYQSIAVQRALDALAADVQAFARAELGYW